MSNTPRPYEDTENHLPIFNENVGKIAGHLLSSGWSNQNPWLFNQIAAAVKSCDTIFQKNEGTVNVAPFAELQRELWSLLFLIQREYDFSEYSWNLGDIYTLACNEAAGGSHEAEWPQAPTELAVDLWPLVNDANRSLRKLWTEPPEDDLEKVTSATFTWVRNAISAGTDK